MLECLSARKRSSATTCPMGQIVIAGSVTGFDCQTNGIGACSHAKRSENRRTMHFDRAFAEAQFIGNLLVELARSQLHQNFTLTWAERCDALVRNLAALIIRPRYIFSNFDLRAKKILQFAAASQ